VGPTAYASPVMTVMRSRFASLAVAALGLVAVGCGASSGSTTPSSSVAPIGIPECVDLYSEGKVITAADFGAACQRDGGELLTPLPVRIECEDDRVLLWNDLAWGYLDGPMALTPESQVQKMPEAELDACTAGSGGVDDALTPPDTTG
jgi:hypothetical protein